MKSRQTRQAKAAENEIRAIRQQISSIGTAVSAKEISGLVSDKAKAEEMGSNMFALLKYMIDENRRTTLILKNLTESLNRLESDLYDQDPRQGDIRPSEEPVRGKDEGSFKRELPLSALDSGILQLIQRNGMACADDIKAMMGYRGRNAASARLSRLHHAGVLSRYQLGHKVYFRLDPKAADALIISPPQ